MSKDNTKDDAKQALIQKIRDAAHTRKITRQYDLLKMWDTGQITGVECIQGIEEEAKIFRIENDLIEHNKGKNGRN